MKKLTNQDIYTRTLKSIVSKKNTILVVQPVHVELLQRAIGFYIQETKKIIPASKRLEKEQNAQLKKLFELSKFITEARREAKQATEIDHLITKISVWPEKEDKLTK